MHLYDFDFDCVCIFLLAGLDVAVEFAMDVLVACNLLLNCLPLNCICLNVLLLLNFLLLNFLLLNVLLLYEFGVAVKFAMGLLVTCKSEVCPLTLAYLFRKGCLMKSSSNMTVTSLLLFCFRHIDTH